LNKELKYSVLLIKNHFGDKPKIMRRAGLAVRMEQKINAYVVLVG